MKISCILTSYNRPRMIHDALRSVAEQSHHDYQLIVIDDSDGFDIREAVNGYSFQELALVHNAVTHYDVVSQNRISINCNTGLDLALGELICYLCDDDYYYPNWFSDASRFFEEHPEVMIGFGKLSYHSGSDAAFSYDREGVRFFGHPISDPFYVLDHNQVIHRRFPTSPRWNESTERVVIDAPDAFFWRELSKNHLFYPIDAYAVVKRLHGKNLQSILDLHRAGKVMGLRE